jgi:hypothetical protein
MNGNLFILKPKQKTLFSIEHTSLLLQDLGQIFLLHISRDKKFLCSLLTLTQNHHLLCIALILTYILKYASIKGFRYRTYYQQRRRE